jgi:AraC-like DNA-binding protein
VQKNEISLTQPETVHIFYLVKLEKPGNIIMDLRTCNHTKTLYSSPNFTLYLCKGRFTTTTEFSFQSDKLAIFCCFKGHLLSSADSLDYQLNKNLLSFALKHDCRKLIKAGTDLELVFLEFHSSVLEDIIALCGIDFPLFKQRFTSCACTVANCSREFFILMRKIYEEAENKGTGYELIIHSIMNQILVQFIRIFSKAKDQNDKPTNDIVYSMKLFMQTNLQEGFSIDDMSSHMGYSRSHLSRLFRQATGATIIQYLNQLRISQACSLLNTTTHTIEEIALQCGYENINYFYRVFKMVTGTKPGEFRNSLVS